MQKKHLSFTALAGNKRTSAIKRINEYEMQLYLQHFCIKLHSDSQHTWNIKFQRWIPAACLLCFSCFVTVVTLPDVLRSPATDSLGRSPAYALCWPSSSRWPPRPSSLQSMKRRRMNVCFYLVGASVMCDGHHDKNNMFSTWSFFSVIWPISLLPTKERVTL